KPAPAAPLDAGGRLRLEAGAIEQRGRIEVPAGVVALRAAAGGLALAASSYTAAPAFTKSFFGTDAFASAGRLSLESTGPITIAEGAVLDVSAPAGGDAGAIGILAGGTFQGAGRFLGPVVPGAGGGVCPVARA